MYMDNPDFAIPFPPDWGSSGGSLSAIWCSACCSSVDGSLRTGHTSGFRNSAWRWSSPKVGYPHGTLRLLKHPRHLAIIVVGKGMKVAEGSSGRPSQTGGTAGSSVGTGSSTDGGKSCGNCFL